MRTCIRCQEKMEEGLTIKVNTYGVPQIARGTGDPREIRAAVCPKCGEISLYEPREPEA